MEPVPTQERRMSYEMKRQELLNGGGLLIDLVGLDQYYKDVVEYKKREEERLTLKKNN